MAETTGIAWCDSTFNPWIGCTKVGPGCDHCYAEAQDSRKRWGGTTHWGAGVPRHRTSESYWKQPLRWNEKQEDFRRQGDAPPWNVFCASLADVFDNDVPQAWRDDLWELICDTPHLEWLLVTKRIGNVEKMGGAMLLKTAPNTRLLITVCNQDEADRDIPKLLALPCKNGISYEPALGPVDWSRWLYQQCDHGSVTGPGGVGGVMCPRCGGTQLAEGCPGLEWIIVGGESGRMARPFYVGWARNTVAQCKAAAVPVFVKQLGSNTKETLHGHWKDVALKDRAGADPAEWPEDLRVREFP